eukprot:2722197-Pyramimonas_sp.AAC.1
MPLLGQLLGGKEELQRCHPVPTRPTISWLTFRRVICLTTPFFKTHVDKVPPCQRSRARSPGCGR